MAGPEGQNRRECLRLQLNAPGVENWVRNIFDRGDAVPVGPVCTLIPSMFHQMVSKEIMKSYVVSNHTIEQELQRKVYPADIPIIVKEYQEEVYPQVSANLNELGKIALETIHPWILNTLVDWDKFDKVICSKEVEAPTVESRKQDGDGAVAEESHSDNQKQFVWPKGTVLKLIDLHQENEPQFKKPGIKKKSVWCKIAAEINQEKEVQVSATQCEQKWKNLTKIFRDTVDHNSKSGNERKECAFFKELEESYGYRPNVKPIYVSGSYSSTSKERDEAEEGISDINDEKVTPKAKKPRQNRKDAVIELMNEMRADFREEQKQLLCSLAQQHEDRMKNEKCKLDLLAKLVSAVQKKD